MTAQIIALRGLTAEAYSFDVVNEQLTNKTLLSMPSTSTQAIEFSASDTYLIAGDTNDSVYAALWSDGSLGTWGTGFDTGNDPVWIAPHPTNPTVFATVNSNTGFQVCEIDPSDRSISSIETVAASGVTVSGVSGTWNEDGTRFAVGSSTTLFLYSWDGSSMTLLDSLALFPGSPDTVSPHWIRGTDRIFVGNNNHTTIVLVDASSDTLSSLDTATQSASSFEGSAVSPNGLYALHGAREVTDTPRLWPLGAAEFGTAIDFTEGVYDGAWVGNGLIATIDDPGTNLDVQLWSLVGSTLTLLDTDSTLSNAQRVQIISNSQIPPPTSQQQFESSYADVSGRDPLATALTQRTPAQNLADYLVSLYAGTNPRIVVKPVQIELGELDKTSPAPASGDLSRQIWIEDDRDPNFAGGRWATVLGRSGGADPGTVELTLFIADNSESFVEPT